MSLHMALALASAAVLVSAGLEAGSRAWRRVAPGRLSGRLAALALLVLVITSAGGLGLWIGGAAPHEGLHFVYAILALTILPIVGTTFATAPARRRGIAVAVAAIVALGAIVRLFQTG
jgi:hypothetical protein